jgi:hypothetical protein
MKRLEYFIRIHSHLNTWILVQFSIGSRRLLSLDAYLTVIVLSTRPLAEVIRLWNSVIGICEKC